MAGPAGPERSRAGPGERLPGGPAADPTPTPEGEEEGDPWRARARRAIAAGRVLPPGASRGERRPHGGWRSLTSCPTRD